MLYYYNCPSAFMPVALTPISSITKKVYKIQRTTGEHWNIFIPVEFCFTNLWLKIPTVTISHLHPKYSLWLLPCEGELEERPGQGRTHWEKSTLLLQLSSPRTVIKGAVQDRGGSVGPGVDAFPWRDPEGLQHWRVPKARLRAGALTPSPPSDRGKIRILFVKRSAMLPTQRSLTILPQPQV